MMEPTKRLEAKRMMEHYMRTVWESAGLKWDYDNSAEMQIIIDYIVDAAKEEVKKEMKNELRGLLGD